MPIRACLNPVYNQLDWLFEHLDPGDYATPLELLGGASVGQHVRHILGFFECLLQGLESGAVNYDARPRELRIEADLAAARALFDQLERRIAALPPDRSLLLIVSVGTTTAVQQQVTTSLDRELHYVAEHAMHHLALIRYGAQAQWPSLRFPADFGFATSTLRARVVA